MIDWTPILVTLVGGGGIVAVVLQEVIRRRGGGRGKDAEDRVVEQVHTPANPGTTTHTLEAVRLAQEAMSQAAKTTKRLERTEERLQDVERQLGVFRRSYRALYAWAQVLIIDWEDLKEHPDPPPLPGDIHHPDH